MQLNGFYLSLNTTQCQKKKKKKTCNNQSLEISFLLYVQLQPASIYTESFVKRLAIDNIAIVKIRSHK